MLESGEEYLTWRWYVGIWFDMTFDIKPTKESFNEKVKKQRGHRAKCRRKNDVGIEETKGYRKSRNPLYLLEHDSPV